MPVQDKSNYTASDKRLANFIQLLKEKRLEMNVPIKGQPFLAERRKRISRLTGLPK